MSTDHDRRVREVFEAALQHDPSTRASFLEGVFVLEPAIQEDVESLLAAHEEADLSRTPYAFSSAESPTKSDALGEMLAAVTSTEAAPGHRFGPYKIIAEIGEGGMGTVYEAEQEEPIRRKVALKLIKWGMDTREVIARFESERQALALMNHPNIAAIYGAGATDAGRPFFAMEFVKGLPINKYCDKYRLSVEERLRLFIQICDGVQHAHQKGIIHRDIKPSNVLVTLHGDQPVPKLIDFGLAKATSSHRLTERSLYTELGQLIGTPNYMSPEQAEVTSLDIDTRTDIYSLGALLYELLVGTTIFDPVTIRRASFAELQHLIRDEEPPKPSTRLSGMGSASAVADNRRTEPGHLKRFLRGDLDWVTMKALEKDRTRRYETANAVKLEVLRVLNQEPVLARPPSSSYRAMKFIRRHKLGVSAAGAVAIALLFGIVSTTLSMIRARTAERIAVEEASASEAVSEFLVSLFQVADPAQARGSTITAREILEQGVENIDGALEDQPEVRARLIATLGRVHTNIGLYEEAEPLLLDAVETNRRVRGPIAPETLAAMNELANLYWYQNRFEDAEPLYLEVVKGSRISLGEEDQATLRAQFDLASLYLWLERYEEAETLSLQTLEAQGRVLGEGHNDTIDTMHNLASMYYLQGRYEESAEIGEKVMEQTRNRLGPDHPDTLTTMHNLATSYHGMGRLDDAERLYMEVIDLKRRVLGDAHQQTADSVRMLGKLCAEQGRYIEAEEYLLDAYQTYVDAVGNEHERTRETLSLLVDMYESSGQPEKAATYR